MNVNAYTGGMAASENLQVIFREAKIGHAKKLLKIKHDVLAS